jgi:hypothetical protein
MSCVTAVSVLSDIADTDNQRMAKHLGDKTGCLEACHKRCEELAAILRIQLKINGSCRRGQKQLFLARYFSILDLLILKPCRNHSHIITKSYFLLL